MVLSINKELVALLIQLIPKENVSPAGESEITNYRHERGKGRVIFKIILP